MALYSNIALKATQGDAPFRYLGVINDATESQGYLHYSTDQVLTKNAKFAVEHAYGDLIHIRSCVTNKYWGRSSSNGFEIVARGVEPVVDTTSWTCTLFRMDVDDDRKTKFYHIQSCRTVRLNESSYRRNMSLTIDPATKIEAVSSIVDYDTLVVLPKFVAFKGSNGLYYKNLSLTRSIKTHMLRETGFLVSDIGDPDIVCEMQNTCDGAFRVRATSSNTFWTYSAEIKKKYDLVVPDPNHVVKDVKDMIVAGVEEDDNPNQIFGVTRLDKNVVALRSLVNQKFCAMTDFGGIFTYRPSVDLTNQVPVRSTDQVPVTIYFNFHRRFLGRMLRDIRIEKEQLVATADGLISDTYLEVVEPVINRTVNVYEFDLNNARIYNVSLLYSHEHVWDNYSDENQKGTANGSISTAKSHAYKNSITVSGSVKTTFDAGVPFVGKNGIEVSASATYSYGWEYTETETQNVGHVFEVVVKPMKRTIARGVATKGTCDVPFSYVQKDYPADGGPPRLTKLKDGVFTGTNAYNFHDEVRYEDLPVQVSTKIVARGVEPVVDTTSWTCTLFRMDVDDDKKTKFYHVQSGRTVRLNESSSSRKMSLTIDPATKTEAVSSIVDYDSLVELPKFVAFKGSNGLYYKNLSLSISKIHKLRETAGFLVSDIGDPDIVCEMQNTCDGAFRVKAANSNTFWTYCTQITAQYVWVKEFVKDLIIAGVEEDDNPNQIFAVTRLDKNVVALRSLVNKKFCTRTDFRDGFIYQPSIRY